MKPRSRSGAWVGPSEVAAAVLFLARRWPATSPGHVLEVDGGFLG